MDSLFQFTFKMLCCEYIYIYNSTTRHLKCSMQLYFDSYRSSTDSNFESVEDL